MLGTVVPTPSQLTVIISVLSSLKFYILLDTASLNNQPSNNHALFCTNFLFSGDWGTLYPKDEVVAVWS
jgi:hypothetical protein